MEPIRDLAVLLENLEPHLDDGEWVFCFVEGRAIPAGVDPVGTFAEDEGLTLILDRMSADRSGLRYGSTFAKITLRVQSSLDAVGLTAAVAGALAREGIAANVVAAFHHDHLFVPAGSARRAIEILRRLQRGDQRPATGSRSSLPE